MTERDDQDALFRWAAWKANARPEYALLYAIPNGQYRPGQRPEPGMKRGVPDVCLPVPRGEWHGLYVELKHGRNTTTKAQDWWLAQLAAQGYRVAVARGFDEAVRMVEGYVEGESDERR